VDYLNTNLPTEERIDDLISRMSLDEKISQLGSGSPAIERLGIPYYHWWNECLHGVGRAGIATVFPQAIGLAATWNPDLMERIGTVISDEARAKHHQFLREGIRRIYTGLTFWTPNINIFRDPRWGRGQETYGEDPYLTAHMAVPFIKALQGHDPKYLKIAACAKHFAVHSGPEAERHSFNATVSEKDLVETYLPAFEAAVREANVEAVMSAYNRTNGEACSASPRLLQTILREEWDFAGHIVSDCGAVDDIYQGHAIVSTAAEAAALALKTGCDLCCGDTYKSLNKALEQGLLDEATIDTSLKRLLRTRFRLGVFDPEDSCSYAQIPYEINASALHTELALEAARQSIVLLKNTNNFLPLRKDIASIAVIGPNADEPEVLLANYHGKAKEITTPLLGIQRIVSSQTKITHARGSELREKAGDFEEALRIAQEADVAIVVLGLSQALEGEEGETPNVGDRTQIELLEAQENLIKAIYATGTPVVLVLINGSPIAINWANEHVSAIVEAWYPGQAGGTAIAEVLFGDYNPAGRLPVTFYESTAQLPDFRDYSMKGRTYRYLEDKPLYPFGFGLSYTQFHYRDLQIRQTNNQIEAQVTVENIGERSGDEVVQLYLRDINVEDAPIRHLEAFRRLHLQVGENQTIIFQLLPKQFSYVTKEGKRILQTGRFEIFVGGGQPGFSENVLSLEKEIFL
jgi:beta-glucosidase